MSDWWTLSALQEVVPVKPHQGKGRDGSVKLCYGNYCQYDVNMYYFKDCICYGGGTKKTYD